VNPDFLFFLAVHNFLFAHFDFVDQSKQRFPVKGVNCAVLPDQISPRLRVILYGLGGVELLFQLL
jgi:hypothetical protein